MTESVESFRECARAWIESNLETENETRRTRGLVHRTFEDIAHERARQAKLHEAGFAGITWPTEYGGLGLTAEHQQAWLDESRGYRAPDLGIAGAVTNIVCAPTLLLHGSEELKRKHIPRILSGEELWVEFFSEPGAGSDLAAVTTTAVRDGNAWVLNGEKIWSSGAYYADWGLCLARTDWDVPKHQGLTWFAVDLRAPGVVVEPLREITGDIEFCHEVFTDVRVSDSERIGAVGDGWKIAGTVLQFEREASSGSLTSNVGELSPGDLAPDLVHLARRAGRLDDPHILQLIVNAHIDSFAVRAVGARMARRMAEGDRLGAALISYSKLAAGLMEPRRAKLMIQIGGAAAVAWDRDDLAAVRSSLDYLNSRVTSIAGGTNEIQKNAIGERVLSLPREPAVDRDKPFVQVQEEARNWGR